MGTKPVLTGVGKCGKLAWGLLAPMRRKANPWQHTGVYTMDDTNNIRPRNLVRIVVNLSDDTQDYYLSKKVAEFHIKEKVQMFLSDAESFYDPEAKCRDLALKENAWPFVRNG